MTSKPVWRALPRILNSPESYSPTTALNLILTTAPLYRCTTAPLCYSLHLRSPKQSQGICLSAVDLRILRPSNQKACAFFGGQASQVSTQRVSVNSYQLPNGIVDIWCAMKHVIHTRRRRMGIAKDLGVMLVERW